LNVGDLVKKEELHNGWDDEFECWVIDEDKVSSFGGRQAGSMRHEHLLLKPAASCQQGDSQVPRTAIVN